MIPKYLSVPVAIFSCTMAGYLMGSYMGDWYTYSYYGAAVGCAAMAGILSEVPALQVKVEGV